MTTNTKEKAQKPMSKSEIAAHLSESTGLTKAQIVRASSSRCPSWSASNSAKGPGVFTLPGLLKIKVVRKPAVPERTGINPFTKQETMFKAKPARNVIKLQALKNLKQMV